MYTRASASCTTFLKHQCLRIVFSQRLCTFFAHKLLQLVQEVVENKPTFQTYLLISQRSYELSGKLKVKVKNEFSFVSTEVLSLEKFRNTTKEKKMFSFLFLLTCQQIYSCGHLPCCGYSVRLPNCRQPVHLSLCKLPVPPSSVTIRLRVSAFLYIFAPSACAFNSSRFVVRLTLIGCTFSQWTRSECWCFNKSRFAMMPKVMYMYCILSSRLIFTLFLDLSLPLVGVKKWCRSVFLS